MPNRRRFLKRATFGATMMGLGWTASNTARALEQEKVQVSKIGAEEDIFEYIQRTHGRFDFNRYCEILGAANEYKEGDEIIGVAAADNVARENSRRLLERSSLHSLNQHPLRQDQLFDFANSAIDKQSRRKCDKWTLKQLSQFLLTSEESAIQSIMPGLSSQVIGCVVKFMSNEQLIAIGAKIHNPLPGSHIGAKGYMGARVQPNSPTDNVDDIRWQVFNAWAYGVGDVLLGTNPVSSDPASVLAIERTLKDLLATFDLEPVMPHCVLSHVDIQSEVEESEPNSTALWFQSIGGTDTSNKTFDISVEKMIQHAQRRTGQFGLYFETGQGADFTNGHGHGFDMVLHEARKYGFARALKKTVRIALRESNSQFEPWVHLNDVAGFIGPEVFRTRQQLVRCCLEDIVMGKLHGLCIGLDICSTLHMDVSLDDLDWCIEHIMPANPAYLMALPTKIDPMLGYLTTGYQDHVRIREKFGYKVNDQMWEFFQTLGVVHQDGSPGPHFGDPIHVFLQYQKRQGDSRQKSQIVDEGRQKIQEVQDRGVFISSGYGRNPWELKPELKSKIQQIYADAKKSIWTELDAEFVLSIRDLTNLRTNSKDRTDYILHPETGEQLTADSQQVLQRLKAKQAARFDVQIVISDGLNAQSIMDEGHLLPYIRRVRRQLLNSGFNPSNDHIVVHSGRVRAGYRIGELLFSKLKGPRAILHVIGERPGTGHHTFSVYITTPDGSIWATPGKVDHNITKVVSGIAATALLPVDGADETVRILKTMV